MPTTPELDSFQSQFDDPNSNKGREKRKTIDEIYLAMQAMAKARLQV